MMVDAANIKASLIDVNYLEESIMLATFPSASLGALYLYGAFYARNVCHKGTKTTKEAQRISN
jgi:hypothetical protein